MVSRSVKDRRILFLGGWRSQTEKQIVAEKGGGGGENKEHNLTGIISITLKTKRKGGQSPIKSWRTRGKYSYSPKGKEKLECSVKKTQGGKKKKQMLVFFGGKKSKQVFIL